MAASPLVVYLDTSDYTRLADCRAGRGHLDLAPVFERLLAFKQVGAVRFAYSMPILSELLQYEGGGRELTLRKAAVIEELCEGTVFRYLTQLLIIQIADVAHRNGLMKRAPADLALSAVSATNGWYPAIRLPLAGLREELLSGMESDLAAELDQHPFPNEQLREEAHRAARAFLRGMSFEQMMAEAPPKWIAQMTREYPVSRDTLVRLLPRFMDGNISEAELEQAMFADLTKPEPFARWYFERYEGEKDLPSWMRGFGETIRSLVLDVREKVAARVLPAIPEQEVRKALSGVGLKIGRRLLAALHQELADMGLRPPDVEVLSREELILQVPYFRFLSEVLPAYVAANTGLRPEGRKPSATDGGDIVHAIHLPFCDFWRADTYFATLVKQHTTAVRGEVVQWLVDLPAAIERRLATNPS